MDRGAAGWLLLAEAGGCGGDLALPGLTQGDKAAVLAEDAESLPDEKNERLRQSIAAISREAGHFVRCPAQCR